MNRTSERMVKSGEPFEDEHFEAILELPLSELDRKFVQFFRKHKNKPHTAYQLLDQGFAEKGRFVSVNRVCREHGLWLGIRRVNAGAMWPKTYHAFFVLEPRNSGADTEQGRVRQRTRPVRQHFRIVGRRTY